MLKQYLGERPFWASVHRYLVDHAFDNATTDDLRQAVLDATGETRLVLGSVDLSGRVSGVAVAAKYDSTAGTLTLMVQQTQQDSSKADSATGLRYTTPLAFRMPVTVRVGTAAVTLRRGRSSASARTRSSCATSRGAPRW